MRPAEIALNDTSLRFGITNIICIAALFNMNLKS